MRTQAVFSKELKSLELQLGLAQLFAMAGTALVERQRCS